MFITVIKPAAAIYDPLSVPNNKFGVHLLDPNELEKAVSMVNGNGGDWGYVTIPIRANDRDLAKWTKFMQDAKKSHVIPILRLASFPVDDRWMAPNELDLIDFANFLSELPWPTKNRYVVVYNEPNHKNEWGGFVVPSEYARVLDRAVDIFHRTDQDFFVIAAGFDSAAPNSDISLNEYVYMQIMADAVPGIFSKVDGFSAHAYGNPGFVTAPNVYSPRNIANYRFEQSLWQSYGASNIKLFITEAGWVGQPENYYRQALQSVWTDESIVAITPFVFSAQAGPFTAFSLQNSPAEKLIANWPKTPGRPVLSERGEEKSANIKPQWTGRVPPTSSFDLISSLKAVFLRIFRLGN